MTQRGSRLLLVTTVAETLRGFLLPYAEHFRRSGWFVGGAARGAAACELCRAAFDQVWNVPCSRRPLDVDNLLRAPTALRRIVAESRADILHLHTPVAAFAARVGLAAVARGRRPIVIYTAHGFHFHPRGRWHANALYACLEKAASPLTDYLVVINREDERAAQRLRLAPDGHLRYMPGVGIDCDFFSPDAVSADQVSQARRGLGLGAAESLFTALAEFIPRKRLSDAVAALARLARPDVHLAVAGSGPTVWQVRERVVGLRLQRQVHFVGQLSDVRPLVRASVALLLPSEREGLPRSIMEALALEIPVIATNIRGSGELLREGAGLLVEPGDIDGLAGAMRWMLQQRDSARQMGRRGRPQIVSKHDQPRVLRMHERLYAEALRLREQ